MKKFVYNASIAAIAFALCASTVGCSGDSNASTVEITTQHSESESLTETESTSATETETETDGELKSIGEKTDSTTLCTVKLTNSVGQDIKEFAIKKSTDEEYPDNMLSEDDPFVNDEKRNLYYDPGEITEDTTFDCGVTLADGGKYTLYSFPVSSDEAEICYSADDSLYYVKYKDRDGKDADTLEAEKEGVANETVPETTETSTTSTETLTEVTAIAKEQKSNNNARNNNNSYSNNNNSNNSGNNSNSNAGGNSNNNSGNNTPQSQEPAANNDNSGNAGNNDAGNAGGNDAGNANAGGNDAGNEGGGANDGCLGGDGLFN